MRRLLHRTSPSLLRSAAADPLPAPTSSPSLAFLHARRLEFIGNAPALQVLKLNNNGMGPAGGAMIAGALLENAKKAEREGRKSALRVLVCGASPCPSSSSRTARMRP